MIRLSPKALAFLRKHQITTITVDLESYGGSLPVSHAVVREAPPETKPERYDQHQVDGITVYVFSPMEFRGGLIRIDLQKKLFGAVHLVAGDLKLT